MSSSGLQRQTHVHVSSHMHTLTHTNMYHVHKSSVTLSYFSFSFKLLNVWSICMDVCVYMCICIFHMYGDTFEGQRGNRCLWSWSYKRSWATHWGWWKLNYSASEGACALNTPEPSLQHELLKLQSRFSKLFMCALRCLCIHGVFYSNTNTCPKHVTSSEQQFMLRYL